MSSTSQPDASQLKTLETDINKARELLKKLTGKISHDVGKSQRLPVQELQLAHGVAFFEANKGGMIISAISGHGFLFKKLKHGWSAPVLFKFKAGGIGFSVGFSTSESILVLDDDKAVKDFLHTQVTLDSDMTLAAGKAGRHMHASELNLSHPADSFKGAVYTVAQGAMVDVSLQGVTVSIAEKDMRKLYGADVHDDLVLNGKVPQLPIMEPLLRDIDALIAMSAHST